METIQRLDGAKCVSHAATDPEITAAQNERKIKSSPLLSEANPPVSSLLGKATGLLMKNPAYLLF